MTEHSCALAVGADGIVAARLIHTGESLLCRLDPAVTVRCGDRVIVPSRFGEDVARIKGCVSAEGRAAYDDPVDVVRVATDADLVATAENDELALRALSLAKERVDERRLQMSLVSAHYSLDGSRLMLFFTAETRVDFRDLVKELVHEFRVRIELRQIGVRDESRIVGGLGVCGRVLCCNGVSDRLKAVSIRMAKAQNLSLNSAKISGPCERLLCCLEYEYDFYKDAKRGVPGVGARVLVADELRRVCDVNLLTRKVRLDGPDGAIELPADRLHYDSSTQRWVVLDEAPVS